MRWLIAGSMAMVIACGSVAPVDADLIIWQQLPGLDEGMTLIYGGPNMANDWVADGRSVASVKWWGTNMSYHSFPSGHYQFDLSIWSDNPATAGPDVRLQFWEDALVFPAVYTPYTYVGEYCFELPTSFSTVSGESYWFMVHCASESSGTPTWGWVAAPSTLEERSGCMGQHDGVWHPSQDHPDWPARDLSLEINAVVPEPSTFVLVALGVLALAPLMRRR